MRQYSWKKKFFSTTYYIYNPGSEAESGFLKYFPFRRKAEGEFNSARVHFDTKGVFNPVTTIVNPVTGAETGTITYNFWRSKATVSTGGKEYTWKYDNFWHSKWSISAGDIPVLRGTGASGKGDIFYDLQDPVLILASFHVREYFLQATASAAAAS